VNHTKDICSVCEYILSLAIFEAEFTIFLNYRYSINRQELCSTWYINLQSTHSIFQLPCKVFQASQNYLLLLIILDACCRLQKVVFPAGFDAYATPATSPAVSIRSSPQNVRTNTETGRTRLFGLWRRASAVDASLIAPSSTPADDGPIEELIVSGTAFGVSHF
jgi:hypothetical protein